MINTLEIFEDVHLIGTLLFDVIFHPLKIRSLV